MTDKQKYEEAAEADMAYGALKAIRDLLDDGGIPRGTFADDQVRNLVAMYNNSVGDILKLREALIECDAYIIEVRPAKGEWEDELLDRNNNALTATNKYTNKEG